MRVIEHRTSKYRGSFTSKYQAWRLIYYEEYGDAEAAKDRERQLKGWSRAKKNVLVAKMNPKWRDLISEWENKYGLEFRLEQVRILTQIVWLRFRNQRKDGWPAARVP